MTDMTDPRDIRGMSAPVVATGLFLVSSIVFSVIDPIPILPAPSTFANAVLSVCLLGCLLLILYAAYSDGAERMLTRIHSLSSPAKMSFSICGVSAFLMIQSMPFVMLAELETSFRHETSDERGVYRCSEMTKKSLDFRLWCEGRIYTAKLIDVLEDSPAQSTYATYFYATWCLTFIVLGWSERVQHDR